MKRVQVKYLEDTQYLLVSFFCLWTKTKDYTGFPPIFCVFGNKVMNTNIGSPRDGSAYTTSYPASWSHSLQLTKYLWSVCLCFKLLGTVEFTVEWEMVTDLCLPETSLLHNNKALYVGQVNSTRWCVYVRVLRHAHTHVAHKQFWKGDNPQGLEEWKGLLNFLGWDGRGSTRSKNTTL